MSHRIYFCKSWFRGKKRPIDVWSEDLARDAHMSGQHYTVLVDSIENPSCFLEITKSAVGVSFLDDRLREFLSYDFQEIEPGKLFLSVATYREFEGETDQVANGTSYTFTRGGAAVTEREFFNPHRIESATSSTDVSGNYSLMPAFGEYDDLMRMERN